MVNFTKMFQGDDRLYAAASGAGQFIVVVPGGFGPAELSLFDAWTTGKLLCSFVYTAGTTGVTAATASRLVSAVTAWVAASSAQRGFVWFLDPGAWLRAPLGASSAPLMTLDTNASVSPSGLTAPIAPGVNLYIKPNATCALNAGQTGIDISGAIMFAGAQPPKMNAASKAVLVADGGARQGTISFSSSVQRGPLNSICHLGFQFVWPPAASGQPVRYGWLPLAQSDPTADVLGIDVFVDPSDPLNRTVAVDPNRPLRTVLLFTGKNNDGNPTVFASFYRTRQGAPITLHPEVQPQNARRAGLVFDLAPAALGSYQLAPAGDFAVTVPAAGNPPTAPTSIDLLCGLQGTEVMTLRTQRDGHPGDLLRFTPYQPAYAPNYPFPDVSPVAAPVNPAASLLDPAFTTSWASAVAEVNASTPIGYVAQPGGASLYGMNTPIWAMNLGLLGWAAPGSAVLYKVPFPLFPYAGLDGQSDAADAIAAAPDFERQIVGPTRRQLIDTTGISSPAAYNTVSPSGLLVTIGQTGQWAQILLGQTVNPPNPLAFGNPTGPLQQAFESSDLLLVAANANQLRTTGSGTQATFENTVVIGGWTLAANVGTANRYGDYRNILIVKGRRGRLYDPQDPAGGLLANPNRWTQQTTFAAPTDLVADPLHPGKTKLLPANPAELTVLSQWLQDYFATAALDKSEEMARFNAIAQDENWTGVLILRADIAEVPADLVGILAAVAAPDAFYAHHLGIDLTPVSPSSSGGVPGPSLKGASSMFGLIDYTDPAFTPPDVGQPAQPVRPAAGTVYDFRLLSLKVSFVDTAVRSFHSHSQLTGTSWFDMPILRAADAGNPYGAILLEGSLQTNDGQPLYSMASTSGATFRFANDAVRRLEITGATMSTRDTGEEHDKVAGSWFALNGFLDFHVLAGGTEDEAPFPFDVLSFGASADSEGASRTGLSFSNLGILMTFPKDAPQDAALSFNATETRFDPSTSTARAGSLYRQFALEVSGIVSGGPDTPPSKSGYTTAVTAARLVGVDGQPWWGVDYTLPLGTPGNLAGRAGLTAHLLTAWSPRRSAGIGAPRVMVGLQLPGSDGGARVISLQSVLKLAVGQILLQYDDSADAFLLQFSQIALKLFGLLSVPPGSTLCYLYGNPRADGQAPSGLGWYAKYQQDGGAS